MGLGGTLGGRKASLYEVSLHKGASLHGRTTRCRRAGLHRRAGLGGKEASQPRKASLNGGAPPCTGQPDGCGVRGADVTPGTGGGAIVSG